MSRVRNRDNSPEPVGDFRTIPRRPDDPEVPAVVHPGDARFPPSLRFSWEEDRTDRAALLSRATAHGYAPLRFLTWESVQTLGLYTRVHDLCGPHWRALFDIHDSVCADLAIEFFSTIHMVTPLTDYAREDALTFRLGGAERRLSLRQFAVYMGLYTEAELDTPAFTEGITDWPTQTTAAEFWAQIGEGPYLSPIPKSTKIRDPAIRIVHRALAHTISSRSDSAAGNVTLTDLLFLYCMVSGTPCQIAERLARFLFRMRRGREAQEIFGGGYILRLARAMGIMPAAVFAALPTVSLPTAINMPVLVKMGVARREGRGYVLVDRPPEPAPIQPVVRGGDAGASSSGGGGGTQGQTDTEMPDAPVPPPSQPSSSQPERVFSRGLSSRISRVERMLRLEFAHAEEHRSYMSSMLQILAEESGTRRTLPRPPVRPQELTDFVTQAGLLHTPDPDDQPPATS